MTLDIIVFTFNEPHTCDKVSNKVALQTCLLKRHGGLVLESM